MMNNEQSLEMYLQSQISKVGGLIKASETKIKSYRELFNETILENAKIELSQSISSELKTHNHLTFRLEWLIKQHSDFEKQMNDKGISIYSLKSIDDTLEPLPTFNPLKYEYDELLKRSFDK